MKLTRIALVLLAAAGIALAAPPQSEDMNVLLISIDTLRYDRVGINSDKYVKTPYMDALARKSTVFKRAFAHNPVTLPSHVNILTGTTPPYHGISDNPGFRLGEDHLTLAEVLKDSGYSTGAFIGAFVLDSRFGLKQGFDLYDDNVGTQSPAEFYFVQRRANQVVLPVLDWISQQTQKWFCFVHVYDPHDPYKPPPPFDKEYADDLYSGEVAFVDSEIGRIFEYLRNSGRMKNTVVVLTSDHGEALGEKEEITHSYFAYNSTIHVPLIIHIPGAPHRFVDENVSHVDIFPTVCDLLELDIPPHIQGESLLPIIDGRPRQNPRIYFESLTPFLMAGWAPLTGYIERDLKYIDLPIKEVYDLAVDMKEEKNLASQSDLKTLAANLDAFKNNLFGGGASQRYSEADQDVLRRLRSLGYVSGSSIGQAKKKYTDKDDLKTLRKVQVQIHEAVNLYKEGKAKDAIDVLNKVIKQRADYITAYHLLANAYYNVGELENALDTLKQGIKKNSNNPFLLSRLGVFLVLSKQYDEAIDILKQTIKKEKTNPEFYNYLGVAYLESGDFKKAEENYIQALKYDQNFATVFNNIGALNLKLYIQTRDFRYYNTAISNFDAALFYDPTLTAARNGKAAAEKFRKQIEELLEEIIRH